MKSPMLYPAVIALVATAISFYLILRQFNLVEKISISAILDDLWILYKKFVVIMATIMIWGLVIIGGEFSYSLKWKEFIEFFKNLIK